MTSQLRVIPLGGLGEIGKNMMALEYEDDIIVVDCGVQFPEEGMFGVDLIIPDVSYLVERVDKVRAILITHGHEDHIGALPFILPKLQVPVYAPRLAHGLITAKLKERRAARDSVVHPIDPGVIHQFGESFEVSWFRVCHSIPDAMATATVSTMLRPTMLTLRPCFSAASTTCWTLETNDAKVATITRPSASPIARSSASPTTRSDVVYPGTSA